MRTAFLLGRALFGGFFAYSGYHHLRETAQMASYAQAKGVPKPDAAVQATGVMLLAGGMSVMAGVKPREGLAMLVAFLVPTALQMHRFWEESDPQRRASERTNFSKNLALAGAALALMQIDEPWPASLDEIRSGRSEEMFINLGGRELRALPV
jgi:putative oxidoreductase